jgi:hypothetical protein
LVPRLHRLLVIAESTDALLGNLFELEDLGAKDVKGISEPVGAWAAVRQSYDGCPSAASRRRRPSTRPTFHPARPLVVTRPRFPALPPLFCHTVAALFPFDQVNGRPICD